MLTQRMNWTTRPTQVFKFNAEGHVKVTELVVHRSGGWWSNLKKRFKTGILPMVHNQWNEATREHCWAKTPARSFLLYIGVSRRCLNTVVVLYARSSPDLTSVEKVAEKPRQRYRAWKLSFSSQFCYYQFRCRARRRLYACESASVKWEHLQQVFNKAVMETTNQPPP